MEDQTLIDEEQRRRKQNYARLQKQEEDRKLIADGEGKISMNSQQDTNLSPVGPRKAKTMALKNASEFASDSFQESVKFLQFVLAWYEAERKKRPRSPSPDNHDKNERKRSDKGMP